MMILLRTMLVLATLACPLNCMGALQAAGVPSQGASIEQHQCSCCSHSCSSHKNESAPAVPTDDCQCSNCLCHGAVIETDQVNLDQYDHIVETLLAEDFVAELLVFSQSAAIAHLAYETSFQDAAPPVRILFQSFLL